MAPIPRWSPASFSSGNRNEHRGLKSAVLKPPRAETSLPPGHDHQQPNGFLEAIDLLRGEVLWKKKSEGPIPLLGFARRSKRIFEEPRAFVARAPAVAFRDVCPDRAHCANELIQALVQPGSDFEKESRLLYRLHRFDSHDVCADLEEWIGRSLGRSGNGTHGNTIARDSTRTVTAVAPDTSNQRLLNPLCSILLPEKTKAGTQRGISATVQSYVLDAGDPR